LETDTFTGTNQITDASLAAPLNQKCRKFIL
jgi:hypothetical protein